MNQSLIEEKIVVYDMDDTLWPLNEKACKMAGIDYEKIQHYALNDNVLLSPEERHKLKELYHSVELWKGMKWSKGAKKIHRLSKFGAKVYINSNCLNQDVADFKSSFVGSDLHLPEDQIIFNVSDKFKEKRLAPNTFVFVDDSPFNIEKSTAQYTLIMHRPWNSHIKSTKHRIRVYDVDEATEVIEKLLRRGR